MENLPVTTETSGGAGGAVFMLVYLALIILLLASQWKTFAKAGQPGWACIIPVYNVIVLLQIAKKPIWWIILLFIPFVNIIIIILVNIAVAENFGKGAGFGLGLVFLPIIFFPILAFSDAKYYG